MTEMKSVPEATRSPRFGRFAIAGTVIAVALFVWLIGGSSDESGSRSDGTVPQIVDAWVAARNSGDHAQLVGLTHSGFLTEDGSQHSETKVRHEAALGSAISVSECVQNPPPRAQRFTSAGTSGRIRSMRRSGCRTRSEASISKLSRAESQRSS